ETLQELRRPAWRFDAGDWLEPLRRNPLDAREGRGRQNSIGLSANAYRRERAAPADEMCEEPPHGFDVAVIEERVHHRLHPVTDRRPPERQRQRPAFET